MTVYNVYEPPEGDEPDTLARAEKVTFVKDGFNWVALIVPVFWLLFQRMWIEFIVLLAIIAGLQWAFGPGEHGTQMAGWITLGLTVLFAFEANDLRGWALQRRGYRYVGTASGRDRDDAERSFFTRWLAEQARRPRAPKPGEAKSAPLVTTPLASAPSRPGDTDEVIGSFPRG